MKLGPVTKIDKKRKTTSKNFDDDVMSGSCDVIVIFPIYSQFGAIWMSDSRCIVCKTYIFINSNLLSYKNWKQNWKSSNTALTLLLWVKVLFWPKNADFLQKYAYISKIKEALASKVIFSETTYECVLMSVKISVSYLMKCVYKNVRGILEVNWLVSTKWTVI